jgi:cytoskeletal protein RodZ
MKISFPKYDPGELLTRKRFAPWIIAFVAIGLVAGVCGSYLLGNKFWLLTVAVLGIAGILLWLGVAAAIFPNKTELNETPPSAVTEENEAITSPQWNYRPRKPIRARAVLDSPSAETSDGVSSDSSEINNSAWLNDNSLEDAAPTFIDGPPGIEKTTAEALPQTTDPVRRTSTVEDASVSRYD